MAELEAVRAELEEGRRRAADTLLRKEYEIEDLRKEVAGLRAQLASRRPMAASLEQDPKDDGQLATESSHPGTRALPSPEHAPIDHPSSSQFTPFRPEPVPYEEYVAMTAKVNQYRRMVVAYNGEIEKLRAKLRNSKDISRRWKEYADKVYAKYKEAAGSKRDQPKADSRPATPSSEIHPPSFMITRGLIPVLDIVSDTSSARGRSTSASPQAKTGQHPASSKLRVSEPMVQQDPPSTDTEEALPSRPAEHVGPRPQPIRVKSEPPSSPTLFSPPRRSLLRVETLDLNDVDNTSTTPHRRRRVDAWIQSRRTLTRMNTHSAVKQERSTSLDLDDDAAFGAVAGENMPRRNLIPALKRADSDPNEPVQDDMYDQFVSPDLARRPTSDALKLHEVRVLRPLDRNECVLPLTDDGKTTRKRKSGESRADLVAVFAEDGTFSKRRKKAGEKSDRSSVDSNTRLTELLSEPTPARHRLSPSGLPTLVSLPRQSNRISTLADPVGELQLASVGKHERGIDAKSKARSGGGPSKTPAMSKDLRQGQSHSGAEHRGGPSASKTPLRSKPVSELQLADFKINPRVNQGYDYAFAEPLRTRENRQQGHACIDPSCCGPKMQALADTYPYEPSIPELPTSGIPYGVSNFDARILKEYMGHNYNPETIGNMPTVQQQDLVKQARLRLVAEKMGKHRVLHHRHTTPPGFWNADFSTTQEIESDKEEARKLERQKVEERWREAMREGGLWLFRDE